MFFLSRPLTLRLSRTKLYSSSSFSFSEVLSEQVVENKLSPRFGSPLRHRDVKRSGYLGTTRYFSSSKKLGEMAKRILLIGRIAHAHEAFEGLSDVGELVVSFLSLPFHDISNLACSLLCFFLAYWN